MNIFPSFAENCFCKAFAEKRKDKAKEKAMQLTQKEETLLKDLKGQEQLCVDKYTKYSSEARDPQLKNLFSQIAAVEQGHFGLLTQIGEGNANPNVNASGAVNMSVASDFTDKYTNTQSEDKKHDCYLCTDLIATEKHASSLYDTCIFEFTNDSVRNALAGIQREEQQHAKRVYDYMKKNGMC